MKSVTLNLTKEMLEKHSDKKIGKVVKTIKNANAERGNVPAYRNYSVHYRNI